MDFLDKIKKYKKEGKDIVFTDESGFVESAPRTHGYSIKGERCYVIHDWHPSKRTNVIWVLMEKSLLTVSIFNCNINGGVFNCWVQQDLIPKLPANSVIVMDHAAFYKNEDLRSIIANSGHTIEYLLPYFPDLKPIEPKCFQAKSRRRKY